MVNRALLKACNGLVRDGLMVHVGRGFQYIGPINLDKLAEVDRSYADAFERRYQERRVKERKAEKKFRDYVITF